MQYSLAWALTKSYFIPLILGLGLNLQANSAKAVVHHIDPTTNWQIIRPKATIQNYMLKTVGLVLGVLLWLVSTRMMLKDLVHQLERQKRHDGGIDRSVGMQGHHG